MILAIALLLASGAASPWTISPDQLPAPLRPLPGARNVVAASAAGEFAVSYELSSCYPAAAQLEVLLKRLPAGWVPRKEDFLNPGIPTSNVRGWTHYEDGTTQPPSYVHQWSGEWDDRSGGMLTYDLIFRSRSANETSCKLEISASQLSAPTVRALQSRVQRQPVAPNRTSAIRVVNPDFVVLRPLRTDPSPRTTAVSISGKRLYFDASERLVDLRQLVPESAIVRQTSHGSFVLVINTTAEGAKALKAWSSTHIYRQLGVFLDNRLIDAPVIKSVIDDMIAIDGELTRPQAEEIKRRLLRGGAP